MNYLGRLVAKLPDRPRNFVERCRHGAMVLRGLGGVHARKCPICQYDGKFRAFGLPPKFDAECPRCGSLPRHRLFHFVDQRFGLLQGVTSLIHFAPERIFQREFSSHIPKYTTADLFRHDVDLVVNIERTELPDNSFDAAFVSHVLEHVDDQKALDELNRILKPGGKLVVMIPMIDGWDETYENSEITSERDRFLHFGQKDHVRYYGNDVTRRIKDHGFTVTTYTASPEDCVTYSLDRGEHVFVANKLN